MGKASTLKNAQSYNFIGKKLVRASQITPPVSPKALCLENLSVS